MHAIILIGTCTPMAGRELPHSLDKELVSGPHHFPDRNCRKDFLCEQLRHPLQARLSHRHVAWVGTRAGLPLQSLLTSLASDSSLVYSLGTIQP